MCVAQKLNQPGRTWVVKKLYSELFLILSRSSRSTPVLRPWEVRWLWKACSLINFHNMDKTLPCVETLRSEMITNWISIYIIWRKNHPWHPFWGRKTQRKAAKMVSILIINCIWEYDFTWNLPGWPTGLSGWPFLKERCFIRNQMLKLEEILSYSWGSQPVLFKETEVEWRLADSTGQNFTWAKLLEVAWNMISSEK